MVDRAVPQVDPDRLIVMGRITGLFGVRGWVKVYSHTRPPEGLFDHSQWQVRRGSEWLQFKLDSAQVHGKAFIAKLEGVDSRDAAADLTGSDIAVPRSALPPSDDSGYFWADLVGCRVATVDGVELGEVSNMMETGANDVMIVHGARERLIPFVRPDVIKDVDLARGVITVDWDPEF